MLQFKGKVAVVTGASAGIGAATVKTLIGFGLNVVGLARSKDRLEQLANELEGKQGKLYVLKTDICIEDEIIKAFQWITENVGPVHILINNAGVLTNTNILNGDTEKWKQTLNTNVLGLTIASREAIKIMRHNNIDGHIININSVTGHKVPDYPSVNLYPSSKFAARAITETLRLELIRLGSKIKVTNLSPGMVDTNMAEVSGHKTPEFQKLMETIQFLKSQDIADAIIFVLDTPKHMQVTELIIRPVGETKI